MEKGDIGHQVPELGACAMALDLGEKRIGVAVSDETRTLARPLTVFKRSSRAADFYRIGGIAAEQRANLIVVGLPTLPCGEEGVKAAWVRDYAADLARHVPIEVTFWDESFSTVDAEASLRARGKRGKRMRQMVDATAAAFFLQSYLDEHRQLRSE